MVLALAVGCAQQTLALPISGVLSPVSTAGDGPEPDRDYLAGTATTPTTTTTTEAPPTTTWRGDYTTHLQPARVTTSTVTSTVTTPPTTTVLHQTLQKPSVPQFTLGQLVGYFFAEADRPWALHVVFCESSGQPDDLSSDAVHPSSRASGWFQHLPKFWQERSEAAGFAGESILDPIANVGVAAWLLYDGGGTSHWNESKACWR